MLWEEGCLCCVHLRGVSVGSCRFSMRLPLAQVQRSGRALPSVLDQCMNGKLGHKDIDHRMSAKSGGNVFLFVLAIEAVLSVIDLSKIPGAVVFAEIVGSYVPVVSHFLSNPSANQDVAPYIAITVLLLPLKAYLAFGVVARLSREDKEKVVYFPSSEASFPRKILSSAIAIALNVGLAWYVLFQFGEIDYFSSPDIPRGAITKYHLVSSSGIQMWLGWSVMHLVVLAFLMGVLLAFAIEWIQVLGRVREIGE